MSRGTSDGESGQEPLSESGPEANDELSELTPRKKKNLD